MSSEAFLSEFLLYLVAIMLAERLLFMIYTTRWGRLMKEARAGKINPSAVAVAHRALRGMAWRRTAMGYVLVMVVYKLFSSNTEPMGPALFVSMLVLVPGWGLGTSDFALTSKVEIAWAEERNKKRS